MTDHTPYMWLSVDPGSQHVGLAWWRGETSVEIEELTPQQAMGRLLDRRPARLVVEQFRLYPSHAQTLTGSTMGTSQVIGALAWWAYQNTRPMYLQPAAIKIPTRALMRVNGDEIRPGSIHAQDAYLHGYHWIHRGRHVDRPGTIFTGVNQD